MSYTTKLNNWIFDKVHSSNLIYNACWEDPRCDRKLLDFDKDSKIVMITSAGCNALDYLIEGPASIDCIDLNFRQNAVLALKKQLIQKTDFDTLFCFFGRGVCYKSTYVYHHILREGLATAYQAYWDKHIDQFFTPGLSKETFYHHGTSGTFAWLFGQYIKTQPGLSNIIDELFNAPTVEVQRYWYGKIEDRILNRFIRFIMKRHMVLNLLGIPTTQAGLVKGSNRNGIEGFIKKSMRRVFMHLPISENYFWRVYFYGAYTKECCPRYLKKGYFDTMKSKMDCLNQHTMSISDFLRRNPGQYTHFILLDHLDWLAKYDMQALDEELELILKNAAPGAKILMRSGAHQIDFLPAHFLDKVQRDSSLINEEHRLDRVGTYGCVDLFQTI